MAKSQLPLLHYEINSIQQISVVVRKDKSLVELGFELGDLDSYENQETRAMASSSNGIPIFTRGWSPHWTWIHHYQSQQQSSTFVNDVDALKSAGGESTDGFCENYPGRVSYKINLQQLCKSMITKIHAFIFTPLYPSLFYPTGAGKREQNPFIVHLEKVKMDASQRFASLPGNTYTCRQICDEPFESLADRNSWNRQVGQEFLQRPRPTWNPHVITLSENRPLTLRKSPSDSLYNRQWQYKTQAAME